MLVYIFAEIQHLRLSRMLVVSDIANPTCQEKETT